MQRNSAKMLILGLGAGLLSACAWDIGMVTAKDRSLVTLLFDLFLDFLPGMIYGLAVSLPFARGLSHRRPARVAATAMVGGITFFVAMVVAGLSYAAFSGAGVVLGGFTGSLIFGKSASRLLRSDRSTWPLGWYVLSGTLASLAFIPFCSEMVKGPDTPKLHWSLYLGFMVWQGATAATLALSQAVAKANATRSEEI
jgi:hypothetical protein